jgi:hypothetical protein
LGWLVSQYHWTALLGQYLEIVDSFGSIEESKSFEPRYFVTRFSFSTSTLTVLCLSLIIVVIRISSNNSNSRKWCFEIFLTCKRRR